ncbi:MAG: biotin--[acetyl-CoA-carboxylase] ligase [Acidobacteria bacterium]|nr:biotin--[acetyl-CoA-carboxylase] ligase [Acidobacteriota bacterium]
MPPPSSPLQHETASAHTPSLGIPLLRFDELASTNDTARELAAAGHSEGTAILARRQTAGKGRQGRVWSSPADEGLYLSIILRPQLPAPQASLMPLAAAIAVAEMLSFDFHTAADIKWPNDVRINERKICGILVESSIENGLLQSAILGIGINIAQQNFPDELHDVATSLYLETGQAFAPDEVLPPLLARLNQWYPAALRRPDQVIERWQQLSSFAHDCAVRIVSGDATLEGITRGLTASGALRLELANGEWRDIVAGEVSLRKTS